MAPTQTAGGAQTIGGALRLAASRLSDASGTPYVEAQTLLGAVCGISRAQMFAYPERGLTAAQADSFAAAVARLAGGEPMAYIVGHSEFHGLPLVVTPAVLIPRPETELLVDLCVGLAGDRDCRIVDLGTGSGAIAIAVRRACPRARVTAVDADAAALDVARRNARALAADVECVVSDWFEALTGRRFDIVVSNPPYVASGDPHFAGGIRFEPRAALDGGRGGLDCYERILTTAGPCLAPGAHVVFEHGYDQRDALTALAASCGFTVTGTYDDPAGLPRAMVLQRVAA